MPADKRTDLAIRYVVSVSPLEDSSCHPQEVCLVFVAIVLMDKALLPAEKVSRLYGKRQ
jgi:hypothetical protein